jgi:glycosyltransferase involved in cell wall biosynthesis
MHGASFRVAIGRIRGETGMLHQQLTTSPSRPSRGRLRRWTINGDFLTLASGGVPRYAREVTTALDALVASEHPLARDLEIDLVAPRMGKEPMALDAIGIRLVPEFNRPRLPQFWVQAQLPRHVPGGLLSFCNLAPVAVKRQIACIHDMHVRLMPDSYGPLFRWAHRVVLPILGRRAASITTVSQFSRQHLVDYGIAPAEKITVTYNGSDHVTRWNAERSKLTPRPHLPYVLCLGRDQEYKNVRLLLHLAPLLDAMGLDLWMAGEPGDRLISRHAWERPRNLRLLGRISDDDFKKALSGAVCFLFPSRIEGFGLPAVEAMVSGCPVVASTSPCLPEVCGDAALYADPDDPDAWGDQIRLIRRDPAVRRRLIEAGLARASLYTWRGIAEIYLQLMSQVDLAHERKSALEKAF